MEGYFRYMFGLGKLVIARLNVGPIKFNEFPVQVVNILGIRDAYDSVCSTIGTLYTRDENPDLM